MTKHFRDLGKPSGSITGIMGTYTIATEHRISQADLIYALSSGYPHRVISDSVNQLGHFGAIDLHKVLITGDFGPYSYLSRGELVKGLLDNHRPFSDDIDPLKYDITFNAALEQIGYERLSDSYQDILGQEHCRRRAMELTHAANMR